MDQPGEPASSPVRLDDDGVRLAVLDLVCGQAARGIALNLFIWGLLLVALGEQLPGRTGLAVFGLAVLFSGPRSWMVWAYRHRRRARTPREWERLFGATLVINSLVWGVAGCWLLPQLDAQQRLLVYLFIISIALGTALLYGAHRPPTMVAVLVMLLPSVLWMSLGDDNVERFAAGAGVLVLLVTERGLRLQGELMRAYHGKAMELERAHSEAEATARTDFLTGLPNRRAFREAADRDLAQARRHETPLTLALIDLDRFKDINDRFGHGVGDEALCRFARALRATTRNSDLVGRFGGDEFAVLLEGTGRDVAEAFAGRLRDHLEGDPIPETGRALECSLGFADRGEGRSLDELLARADAALYEAKPALLAVEEGDESG